MLGPFDLVPDPARQHPIPAFLKIGARNLVGDTGGVGIEVALLLPVQHQVNEVLVVAICALRIFADAEVLVISAAGATSSTHKQFEHAGLRVATATTTEADPIHITIALPGDGLCRECDIIPGPGDLYATIGVGNARVLKKAIMNIHLQPGGVAAEWRRIDMAVERIVPLHKGIGGETLLPVICELVKWKEPALLDLHIERG